jgi:oxygen-independent coproporphyrinogen III oxidase
VAGNADGPSARRSFSIYIHIPYCRSRCGYCDFNTYAVVKPPEREYTAALVRELRAQASSPAWCKGTLASVYFGGGTPSLFAADSIRQLLGAVERVWPLVSSAGPAEVTLEANPGTVDGKHLRALHDAGVNRVSFGVQSFQPAILARLGRIHGAQEARAVVDLARGAGFDNVSVDLIFAVPGQTMVEWEADLQTAVDLGPDHISAYSLTFEEGTPFHARRARGEIEGLPEDIETVMFECAEEVLQAAGYRHYEISNYARAGRESRHNMNYWHRGEYLGVGAGAHSFVSDPGFGVRWSNEKDPSQYMRRIATTEDARAAEERLSETQARAEFAFLGLRLPEGIDADEFTRRFGVEFHAAFPHLTQLEADGLVAGEGSRWRLTRRGLMVADSVFAAFL